MTAPRIRREVDRGLCTLVLARAEKLNALDTRAFEEPDEHLAMLEGATDAIGCIVVRAEGRGFCAGADLGAMGLRDDRSPVDPAFKPGVIDRLAALPQPVIAAVHGVCLTGGLELALACDFIVADDSACFGDTHGKWGLVGAWGIGQRLSRRVGRAAALKLMMTSRVIDAEAAFAIGLVDELAGGGGLDLAAASLAREILGNSWHTHSWAKRFRRETEAMPLAEALAHERRNYPGSAPDHAERLARFGNKPI